MEDQDNSKEPQVSNSASSAGEGGGGNAFSPLRGIASIYLSWGLLDSLQDAGEDKAKATDILCELLSNHLKGLPGDNSRRDMAGNPSYGLCRLYHDEASICIEYLLDLIRVRGGNVTAWDDFVEELRPVVIFHTKRDVKVRGTIFLDTANVCWSEVKLESGERILISVAQSGVLVKKKAWVFFGPKLYEDTAIASALTCRQLDEVYPVRLCPAGVHSPALRAFTNAVLHCTNSNEVREVLNRS